MDMDITAVLSDDVLCEILGRVLPYVWVLFRFTAVRKQWLRLVAGRSFLRCIWPESSSRIDQSSLVRFFAQRHHLDVNLVKKVTKKIFPNRVSLFVSALRWTLGPGSCFLTSFICDDTRLLSQAEPLELHDGLLLLHTFPELTRTSSTCACATC